MINRIVLGCTSKQYKEKYGLGNVPSIRPYLTYEQAEAIRSLQIEDIPLLYKHVPFQERKQALTIFYSNQFPVLGG